MVPILSLLLAASDPGSTLVVDVAAEALIDRQRLHEELGLRLPGIELGAHGSGYTLRIARSCSVDALAGAAKPTVCVAAHLADPLGTELLSETIPFGDSEESVTREIAALVAGAVRLHQSRLETLLQVIRARRAPPETAVPAPVAAAGPWVLIDLAAAAAIFPKPAEAVFAVEGGVEIAAFHWLHPRLEAGTRWPRTGGLEGVDLSARETTLAVLAQIPLALGAVDLSFGGGFVLAVVDAEAGIQGEQLTLHAGARVRAEVAIAIFGRLHTVAAVTGDVLPRYPKHLWRGETLSDRGPWSLATTVGLRIRI